MSRLVDQTKTDTQTEMTALAMIARGDTQKSVAGELGISQTTVHAITKRNSEVLKVMQSKMVERSLSLASKNHELAMKRLEKRLEDDEAVIETKDLVSVSREMFSQSQLEKGKPTSITSGTEVESQDRLKSLVNAIESGDEVVLSQIVFNPRD